MATRRQQLLKRYTELTAEKEPLALHIQRIDNEVRAIEDELANTPGDILDIDHTARMNAYLEQMGLLPPSK